MVLPVIVDGVLTFPITTAQEASDMTAPASNASAATGAQAVVANAMDPARRPDVLFRVRRDAEHVHSAWWNVGAFVFVSGALVALMSLVPGGS